jgi:DNA-binding transcriptional MerR regulator
MTKRSDLWAITTKEPRPSDGYAAAQQIDWGVWAVKRLRAGHALPTLFLSMREIATACSMTAANLHQWVSRGHYRPSKDVAPGQVRLFDWRDIACLAVMRDLQMRGMSMDAIALHGEALRAYIEVTNEVPEAPVMFAYDREDGVTVAALPANLLSFEQTLSLGLGPLHQSNIVTFVSVMGAFNEALSRLDDKDLADLLERAVGDRSRHSDSPNPTLPAAIQPARAPSVER